MKGLKESVKFIRESYVDSIAISAFSMDRELLGMQIEGIRKIDGVIAVDVFEKQKGKEIIDQSVGDTQDYDFVKIFPLRYNYSSGKNKIFSYLRVYFTLKKIKNEIWTNIGFSIFYNLIQTLLASIIIFFIIQFATIRHIKRISDFIRKKELKNVKQVLFLKRKKLKKKDELDILVDSINYMLRRINAAERRTNQLNKELENKVKTRTLKLKKTNNDLKKKIEEINAMQAQMVHNEKMASIGQLAAGIAHEINNPTGFISSNLNTMSGYQEDINSIINKYRQVIVALSDKLKKNGNEDFVTKLNSEVAELESEMDIDYILEDAVQLVTESIDGANRIKKIVGDMKDLMHPGNDKVLVMTDINETLESTLNIVHNELKYKAEIKKNYGKIPQIPCIPQQIGQVFINILVNAAHAIEKKGIIRITTWADDNWVYTKIDDSGEGIPRENMKKIFDPFFTSKEVGKGTGLGLHISYNMIKNHMGNIKVKSKVGIGTSFLISLPVKRIDQ